MVYFSIGIYKYMEHNYEKTVQTRQFERTEGASEQ